MLARAYRLARSAQKIDRAIEVDAGDGVEVEILRGTP
jgi:hypothetical protein